jgi:hypothetical protein
MGYVALGDALGPPGRILQLADLTAARVSERAYFQEQRNGVGLQDCTLV